MKIFWLELKKIVCNRSYLLALAGLLCLNGLLLYIDGQKDTLYSPKAYRLVYEEIEDMSAEEADEMLSEKLELCNFAFELMFGGDPTETMELFGEKGQELWEAYQNGACPEYEENVYYERQLLLQVQSEFRFSMQYQQYLDHIQIAAKQMKKLAAIQNVNGFNYRNVQKTADAFYGRTAEGTAPGPVSGIDHITNSLFTDLLALLYLLLIVMALVTREKECHQLLLTRTTTHGRWKLGVCKLCACFAMGGMMVLAFYTVNLFVCAQMYGLGDLGRKIQSLSPFRSCIYDVSVLGYLIIFLFGKFLSYCMIVSLFYLAAVCCRSASKLFGILFVLIGAEALLYYFAYGSTLFANLRALNLVAFVQTGSVLGTYQNLNLWEYPVNYQILFWSVGVALTLVLSLAAVVVFARQSAISGVANKKRRLFPKFSLARHQSLFLHEGYKILIQGRVALFLILYMAAVWYFYQPMERHYDSMTDFYYFSYMLQFEGDYTEEKLVQIQCEMEKLDEEEQELWMNSSGDELLLQMRLQSIDDRRSALSLVLERADYLSGTENGAFVYDIGYRLLIGDSSAGQKDYLLALQMILMLILCLTFVYGVEYETGMAVLLHTYAKGHWETRRCKFLVSVLCATVVYGLTYAPYFYNVLHTYGIQMIHVPAYSIPELSNYSCSILSYLLIVCAIRYLTMVLTVVLIFLISAKIKKNSIAIIVSIAFLVLPLLLALLQIGGLDYLLLNPLWKAKLWS